MCDSGDNSNANRKHKEGEFEKFVTGRQGCTPPSTVQSHSSGRFQTFCVAKTKTEEGDLPKFPADLVPKIT